MEPIPNDILAAANAKSRRLKELVRAPEILVMPGAYDVLSARLFEQMGFPAIQCTSGGIAASLGYPDGEAMSREEFLDITGKIAAVVPLPVNADAERGYSDVAATVRGLIARGVAGMKVGGQPGVPHPEGKERQECQGQVAPPPEEEVAGTREMVQELHLGSRPRAGQFSHESTHVREWFRVGHDERPSPDGGSWHPRRRYG